VVLMGASVGAVTAFVAALMLAVAALLLALSTGRLGNEVALAALLLAAADA